MRLNHVIASILAMIVIALITMAIWLPGRTSIIQPAQATEMATAATMAETGLIPIDWSGATPDIEYAVVRGDINETSYGGGGFSIPVTITKTVTQTVKGTIRFGPEGTRFVGDEVE